MSHVLPVLMADPNWNKRFYYDDTPPYAGMKLARRQLCQLKEFLT